MLFSSDLRRDRFAATRVAHRSTLVALVIIVQACCGCTSPLTSVALRDFLREAATAMVPSAEDEEAAILAAKKSMPSPEDGDTSGTLASSDGEPGENPDADSPKETLEDAIERSLARLADARGLDSTGRDLLVETLEKSNPEDWPAIIESFAASLEAPADAAPAGRTNSAPEPSAAHTPANAAGPATAASARPKPAGGLTIPVTATLPLTGEPAVQPAVLVEVPEPAATEEHVPPDVAEAEDVVEPPEDLVASLRERLADAMRRAPLTVRRACFASKVRGWGSVESFPDSRFTPGQEILVYIELDNVVGERADAGWSSRVETRFRLLDGAGTAVEQWSFPIVEDTADSPRTDYFVRYLIRIPPAVKTGPHRLEAAVTDAIAKKTATTQLSLDVVAE